MKKVECFDPIINENCDTLILGTAPGQISLDKSQYYGNTNNYFWDIIFRLFKNNWGAYEYVNDKITYEFKKELLLQNNIALWDVIKTCDREGSSDKKIQNEVLNDFNSFFKKFDRINKVIFNGKGNSKMSGNKLFLKSFPNLLRSKTTHCLNSTSSQNPNNPFMILNEWSNALKSRT